MVDFLSSWPPWVIVGEHVPGLAEASCQPLAALTLPWVCRPLTPVAPCAGPSSRQPFIPPHMWGLLLQEVLLPFSLTAPEPAPV